MPIPNPPVPQFENVLHMDDILSDKAQPLVLFPVRLETRFFPQADGRVELRVRIYPDKIHIDSHEPELTAAELTWGQHFWKEIWFAGDDEKRRKAAWQQLAERFDPPRAAWVARALRPTNADGQPVGPVTPGQPLLEPLFPQLTPKEQAWSRHPWTRVLPNAWTVFGYKNGIDVLRKEGNPIPDKLPTGPNPLAPEATIPADQLAIDEGMRWLVDFDVAERIGMGIRVTLTKEVAAAGLDFLVVSGIRNGFVSTEGDTTLAELFDAHHYTDGLSFVPPGTPSNNTQDAPSGFSSKDPNHETSYAAELNTPVIKPDDGSNANALAAAFGLPDGGTFFANIPHAAAKEQIDARHMNTALWQATWGYFLLQMLGVGRDGESPLNDSDIDWARRHFIDYVRANGPLPTLRVGKQPYGVLPVTSLNAWKPPTGQETQFKQDVALRGFLMNLRDLWRRNIKNVPHLGRNDVVMPGGIVVTDVDRDMGQVLSMEGLSSSYSIRHLMGQHYTRHLWSFLGADLDEFQWTREHLGLTTAVLKSLGRNWQPRLARALYSPLPVTLKADLVQIGPPGTESLNPNYIASMLATRDLIQVILSIVQQPGLPPPQITLLHLLIRHSMLLEYATAGTQLLIKRGLLQPAERREPELLNFFGQKTMTPWRHLGTKITVQGAQGESQETTVGNYLLGFLPTGEPDLAREPGLQPLSDFRASLAHLQSLRPARLEQLMSGTLDLCSHRLDAWITSFATKRLAEMRRDKPALIGSYGWVVNLKPADARARVVPVPAGEQDPIYQPAENTGFIHAPSLTQASTAAVLRSGHLTHTVGEGPVSDKPFEINLTSERVRLAEWLLDGVRQGQPLGALLGYRFERRLQEGGRPQFIAHFRQVAPLVANKLTQTSQAVENVAANNVVDGLVLSRRWQNIIKQVAGDTGRLTELCKQLNQSALSNILSDRVFLKTELDALGDSVDAVGDALLAESVYQTVRGNPLRAAGTVESIAGGETPPPELEVVRTPRSGIALTHRLLALFSGEPTLPSTWATPAHEQRALAEPHLNAWAARLLGDPGKVRCLVKGVEPITGAVLEPKDVRLDQLGLAPLDLIYALEGGEGGQAEIEQRITYQQLRSEDAFAPSSVLHVSPDRRPTWGADVLSYGEFGEVLRAARKLLTGVRAIDAGDVNLPERNVASGVNVEDLEGRAMLAGKSLRETAEDLREQLDAPDTMDLDTLRGLMLRSAAFGVSGAIPLSAAGNLPADRQALLVQGASIRKEVDQRVEQLAALIDSASMRKELEQIAEQLAALAEGASIRKELEQRAAQLPALIEAASTPEARRDHALAVLRITFGKSFVVLPRFTADNVDELALALDNSTKLQAGDPLESVTWFLRMARVRDGVARLDAALSNAEAVGADEKLKLSVAQLPHATAGERWVGLPLKGKSLPGGKLSLVVQSGVPFNVRHPLAGVLFDEWVEVLPSVTETTGISFQYDQPNAAPPQTILVAVPPDPDARWTHWSLQQVLLETLDLARVRAADPDVLGEVGHYLPALYFAHNRGPLNTVSTDLGQLKQRQS